MPLVFNIFTGTFDYVGTGAVGPAGATGPAGPPGVSGVDGDDGTDSLVPGPPGAQGTAGASGSPGATGAPGPMGPPGDTDGGGGDEAFALLGIPSSVPQGTGIVPSVAFWSAPNVLSGDGALTYDTLNGILNTSLIQSAANDYSLTSAGLRVRLSAGVDWYTTDVAGARVGGLRINATGPGTVRVVDANLGLGNLRAKLVASDISGLPVSHGDFLVDGDVDWAWMPGPAGASGIAGTPGIAGTTGPPGFSGADGDDGSDSLVPGPQGAPGLPGTTGPQGNAGSPGSPGHDGDDGADWHIPGPQGLAGATGLAGVAGPPGFAGIDGDDGQDWHIPGPTGSAGATGATGPQGVSGLGAPMDALSDGEGGDPYALLGVSTTPVFNGRTDFFGKLLVSTALAANPGGTYRAIEISPTVACASAGGDVMDGLEISPTLTFSNTVLQIFRGVHSSGVFNQTGDPVAGATFILFQSQATLNQNVASAHAWSPTFLLDATVLNLATGLTVTSPFCRGFNHNPTIKSTGTGALTVTELSTVLSAPAISSAGSVSITDRLGVQILEATVAGVGTVAIGTSTGMDIADLTRATTNLSVRSRGALVQMRHAGPGVFGADAARTNASVGLEVQSTTLDFLPSVLTTTQETTLTGVAVANGMLHYNATTLTHRFRENAAWLNLPQTGNAQVDFGFSTGEQGDTATVTVTGQAWVTATSKILACVFGDSVTADHDPDDASIEDINVTAQNIVAGTGFDLVAYAPDGSWGRYTTHWIGA